VEEVKSEAVAVPHESPSTVRSIKRHDFIPLTNGIIDNTADELSTNEYPAISPLKNRSLNLNERLAESTGAGVTPKGILSPSKKRGPRPQKNVSFNKGVDAEVTTDVFFEDLPKEPSAKKKPGRKPKQVQPIAVATDEIICGVCSRPDSQAPNEIILCDNCDFAVHQMCYGVREIPEGDWLCKSCAQEDVLGIAKKPTEEAPEITADPVVAPVIEVPDIPNLDYHLRALQRVLLDRCSGRRSVRMFGQQDQYEKAQQLIEQTVVAGEGNSMLLIGPRGCGKTTVYTYIF
jgi:origin recognition complex subunit 4